MTTTHPITHPPAPSPVRLAGIAAAAITQLCATTTAAAREVTARGGERSAWLQLPSARKASYEALWRLYCAIASPTARAWDARVEVARMAEACLHGVAEDVWAIRVKRIVQECAGESGGVT